MSNDTAEIHYNNTCQLPVETWMDILVWIKRLELANGVNSTNRLLNAIGDPMVYEEGEIRMKNLLYHMKEGSDEAVLENYTGTYPNYDPAKWREIPILTTPIPINLVMPERDIDIYYVDKKILDFLRLLQPIFHDLSLVFGRIKKEFFGSTEMDQLLQIFSGRTKSLHEHYENPEYIYERHTAYVQTVQEMNFEVLFLIPNFDLVVEWLNTPLGNGKRRVMEFIHTLLPSYNRFVEKLIETFRSAQTRAFYEIRISGDSEWRDSLTGYQILNEATSECLVFERSNSHLWTFVIRRQTYVKKEDGAQSEMIMGEYESANGGCIRICLG